MPRGFSFWTVYACMLSVLFQACANADEAGEKSVPAKETARTDALGDPLLPGAVLRIGTLRMQHQGPVGGIALSPDGKLVASYSSSDGCLRVWSAATGKELRRLNRNQVGTRSFSSNSGSSSNLGHSRSTRAIGSRLMRAINT